MQLLQATKIDDLYSVRKPRCLTVGFNMVKVTAHQTQCLILSLHLQIWQQSTPKNIWGWLYFFWNATALIHSIVLLQCIPPFRPLSRLPESSYKMIISMRKLL